MGKKEKCKYWNKCYRKDPAHKKEFQHPGDKIEDDENEKMDVDEAPVKLRRQKTHELSQDVEDGDIIEVKKTVIKKKSSQIPSTSSATPQTTTKSNDNDDDEEEDEIKPKCKYWEKCYRKDPNHLNDFLHPPRRASSRPKPSKKLEDGSEVNISGGFKLKRLGSDYECSCIGWKTQKNPTNKRTCKHLREYLGDVFELARVGKLPVEKRKPPTPTQHFSHISISLLLAHKYDEKVHDPKGWWISEKLDGVRAFWNGKCFYSRLGNPFIAPKWFTKDLPSDMHLDGELFGGRKQFQSTVSIVKTPECDAWKKIKYCVFDSPSMGKDRFEKRVEAVKKYFEDETPQYAEFVTQEKCKSKEQLDKELQRVLKLGGEGLMIREPGSVYERKRSHTLLKIKKFYDAEAIVIGYEPGKGRFTGAVGALKCKMECGKTFKVGSGMSDKEHRRPPKIGSIITYKFQEYSNSGVPRFPTYLGVRIDATQPKDAEMPKTVLDV